MPNIEVIRSGIVLVVVLVLVAFGSFEDEDENDDEDETSGGLRMTSTIFHLEQTSSAHPPVSGPESET